MYTIYKLTCQHHDCNMVYIGQTSSFRERLKVHKSKIKRAKNLGVHKPKYKDGITRFYEHMANHGCEFKPVILDWVSSKYEALKQEKRHMNHYRDDELLNMILPKTRVIVKGPPDEGYAPDTPLFNLLRVVNDAKKHFSASDLQLFFEKMNQIEKREEQSEQSEESERVATSHSEEWTSHDENGSAGSAGEAEEPAGEETKSRM